LRRHDIWLGARRDPPAPDLALPAQSFKIHISATPPHALAILDLTVPILTRLDTEFKLCADPRILFLINSKQFPRGHSGKFLTAYPVDQRTFESLIERLSSRRDTNPSTGRVSSPIGATKTVASSFTATGSSIHPIG